MGVHVWPTRTENELRLMAVDELFKALGDPSRLEMICRLSSNEAQSINSLSQGLEITRQGARKHLQILIDAKLIKLERKGRDTVVRLQPQRLEQGMSYFAQLEEQWANRLESLRRFVEVE